jgi:nitroimidazol reductase NimA-like FMN-containing flavoprotein (pyridoxamine 5'-phosphate oxidase superfamily)
MLMRRESERWRAIEARLGREKEIWLATVRADGRPHLVPVWFVWLEERLFFATGNDTQKWRNLITNQSVALSLVDAQAVVIVEGEAHAVGQQAAQRLAEHFAGKYDWDFRADESAEWRLVEITPHRILAWGDGYDEELGIRVRG